MTSKIGRLMSVCTGVLLVSGTLVACGGDDDAVSAADVSGKTFTTTEIDGATIAPGSTITITFVDESSLSVQAGCNTMNGAYTIEDGKLSAPMLASTMMACDQALMDQDTLIAGFLAAGPTIELDGNELELEQGEITLELTQA